VRILTPFAIAGAKLAAVEFNAVDDREIARLQVDGLSQEKAEHLRNKLAYAPAFTHVGFGWIWESTRAGYRRGGSPNCRPPEPKQIKISVEAKHRTLNKALLKELLGVRREMSFRRPGKNPFAWWTSTGNLWGDPLSVRVLFCSDSSVKKISRPRGILGHYND